MHCDFRQEFVGYVKSLFVKFKLIFNEKKMLILIFFQKFLSGNTQIDVLSIQKWFCRPWIGQDERQFIKIGSSGQQYGPGINWFHEIFYVHFKIFISITNTILISRVFQDSFDSFDDIEEMVMATNNLSLSPNSASEANRDSLNVSGEEDELPRCIIVTNVDPSVFDNIDIKVGRRGITIISKMKFW